MDAGIGSPIGLPSANDLYLIVLDFGEALIKPGPYKRGGGYRLLKHLVHPKRVRKLPEAGRLGLRHKSYSVERRTKSISGLSEGMSVDKVRKFGEKLVKHMDENVLRLLEFYPKSIRAIVSIDDRRVVEPALEALDKRGLHVHSYIVNNEAEVGGKLVDEVFSYAQGVVDWSGKAINSAQDKLEAFIAILTSYNLKPPLKGKVLYVNDYNKSEREIDEYMKKNGGYVVKAADLPSLLPLV
jgi:hypothetical protein